MTTAAAVGRRRRRRWAPPRSAEVDWGHPLAVGLIAIGAGATQWSDRVPKFPTTNPSVIRSRIATPQGPGFGDRGADTDGPYTYAAPAVPATLTLMAVVNCLGANPDDSGAVAWITDGAVGVLLGVGAANTPGPNVYVLDRGVGHQTTSTPIAQTGWRTIAVSTTTGSTMSIYLDGRLIQTRTGGHGTGASDTPRVCVGAESASGRCFDGQIGTWGVWNRVLNAGEHIALHVDPFQMLR
jgi:hypothetical protein